MRRKLWQPRGIYLGDNSHVESRGEEELVEYDALGAPPVEDRRRMDCGCLPPARRQRHVLARWLEPCGLGEESNRTRTPQAATAVRVEWPRHGLLSRAASQLRPRVTELAAHHLRALERARADEAFVTPGADAVWVSMGNVGIRGEHVDHRQSIALRRLEVVARGGCGFAGLASRE